MYPREEDHRNPKEAPTGRAWGPRGGGLGDVDGWGRVGRAPPWRRVRRDVDPAESTAPRRGIVRTVRGPRCFWGARQHPRVAPRPPPPPAAPPTSAAAAAVGRPGTGPGAPPRGAGTPADHHHHRAYRRGEEWGRVVIGGEGGGERERGRGQGCRGVLGGLIGTGDDESGEKGFRLVFGFGIFGFSAHLNQPDVEGFGKSSLRSPG